MSTGIGWASSLIYPQPLAYSRSLANICGMNERFSPTNLPLCPFFWFSAPSLLVSHYFPSTSSSFSLLRAFAWRPLTPLPIQTLPLAQLLLELLREVQASLDQMFLWGEQPIHLCMVALLQAPLLVCDLEQVTSGWLWAHFPQFFLSLRLYLREKFKSREKPKMPKGILWSII